MKNINIQNEPLVRLISFTSDPEYYDKLDTIVEFSGRVCYMSLDKMNSESSSKFIRKVVHTFKHESIAGHTYYNLLIFNNQFEGDEYYRVFYELMQAANGNLQGEIVQIKDMGGKKYIYGLLIGFNWRSFKQMLTNNPSWGMFLGYYLKKFTKSELFSDIDFLSDTADLKPFNVILVKDVSKLTDKPQTLLRYNYATFFFSNVNRTFSHQLIRHMGVWLKNGFSEMSQRYVDPTKKNINHLYSLPIPLLKAPDYLSDIYKLYINNSIKAYTFFKKHVEHSFRKGEIDIHKPEELARDLLPNAINTNIVMSATLESWKHFVTIRSNSSAQYHIRYIAHQVDKKLKKHFDFF